MAEKLGMSVTGYAKLERGESQIRIERLIQIAQIFDVEPSELFNLNSDGVSLFNHYSDNFIHSSQFHLALGDSVLESKISHLRDIIEAKNELLNAREREIESLKAQINALNKVIERLEVAESN